MAALSSNATYAPISSFGMQARPSGRSSYDPERLLERNIRQARTAGEQAQSALARETLQNQRIETERLRRRQKIQDFGLSKVEQILGIGGNPQDAQPRSPSMTGATMARESSAVDHLSPRQPSTVSGYTPYAAFSAIQGGPTQGLAAGWANPLYGGDTGSRAQNVAQAMKNPAEFSKIIDVYNRMAAGTGKMMDAQGNIVDATEVGNNPAIVPGQKMEGTAVEELED